MNKIVVIGSINNDLVIGVDKAPIIGETVRGSGFIQVPGGKGANQAVACARLGADVSFVGAVGDDNFGITMKHGLADNHVDVSFVKTVPDKPTGTAMIILVDGDNYIAVDQGANLSIDREQIDSADELIKNAAIVILQLEIPLDCVKYAAERCKAHGIPVILNPAPAPVEPIGDDLLMMVDLLTPNEFEAFSLTGIEPVSPGEAIRAAKRLSEMGVKQVVITLGGNGCIYGSGTDFRHMPAVKVENIVDTTAAGDSFTAALAVCLTEGKSLEQAVAFATKVGALTVSRKGAQPSLPYWHEIM